MDGGMRSVGSSGVFVKNSNSSGCLIIRKKGDGVTGGFGSSSSKSLMDARKEKRRPSAVASDSGSSDDLLTPSRRRACPNDMASYEKAVIEDSGIPSKRQRLEQLSHNEDGLPGMCGYEEREKNSRNLDKFDYGEYNGIDGDHIRRRRLADVAAAFGERRITGSIPVGPIGNEREYESVPSRYMLDQSKHLHHDKTGGLNLGDFVDPSRLKMNGDGGQEPNPMLRRQYMARPDEAIRIQGKNGVLKVFVNKKKVDGGTPFEHVDRLKPLESRRALKTEGTSQRNIHLLPYLQPQIKRADGPDLVVRTEKTQLVPMKSTLSKEIDDDDDDDDDDERNSENSDTSLKLGLKKDSACKSVKRGNYEDEPRLKNVEARKPTKRMTAENELTPLQEKLSPGRRKEGKAKRGSGTEKQKLRERIRSMLLDMGWTIDYRPRRNREYLDAVYINPSGTAYWSIIKAYEALQKQLNEDKQEIKLTSDVGSSYSPIADDVLNQLTRKTRKKLEKEMKMKKKKATTTESATESHHQHK